MKYIKITLVLATIVSINTLSYAGSTINYNGINYNILSEPSGDNPGTCEVGSNNNLSGKAVIPSSVEYDYKTYEVIKIGIFAFSGSSLTSIELPVSLTTIDTGAFMDCASLTSIDLSSCIYLTTLGRNVFSFSTSLTKVVLPNSLATIEGAAFSYCLSLTNIDLLGCDALTYIEHGAFEGCTSLTSIDLSSCNNLTYIDYEVFKGCSSLVSIDLSSCINLTYIGTEVFRGCTSLTNAVLPCSLIEIDSGAFYDCSSLTDIDLSGCINLTYIGANVFSGCTSITSMDFSGCTNLNIIGYQSFWGCSSLTSVNLSTCTNLTRITGSLFNGCTSLTAVTLPASLAEIEPGAFMDCASLTSIDLSSYTNLTDLGYDVFRGCSSLNSVILPSSLNEIGSTMFYNCSNLSSVFCYAENPPKFGIFNNYDYLLFDSPMTTNGVLYVPAESVELYKKAKGWKDAFKIEAIEGASAVDYVYSDGMFESGPVDVYDLSGRLIRRQASEDQLQDLRPGIYIFRQGTVSKKILIQ